MTALLVTVGCSRLTGVVGMSGGLLAMPLAHYTSLHLPWGPLSGC